jgi:hypothetical protein
MAGPDVAYLASIDEDGTDDLYIVEFGRVYAHDVGTVELLAPTGSVELGQSVTPRAAVKNFGTSTESFQARFEVGDGYSDQVTVSNLAPGDTQHVSFAPWMATVPGTFEVRCSTVLASDERPWNDEAADSVFVILRDVGAEVIVAPTGSYELGDAANPVGTWHNHGNVAAGFQAWMVLDDPSDGRVYAEGILVSGLGPGEDTTLDYFPPDTFLVGGTWSVRCSSYMANDMVDTNDFIDGTFAVGRLDIGLNRLLAPLGTKDTNTVVVPSASVKNHGDVTTGLRAWYAMTAPGLGEVYREFVTVASLAPGDEDTLVFPGHDVGTVEGSWGTMCSVYAAGDDVPDNDSMMGSFIVHGRTPWPYGWEEVESMPSGPSGRSVKRGGWLAIDDEGMIYAAKGYKTQDFYRYDPFANDWSELGLIPFGVEGKPPSKGCRGVFDGDEGIYMTKGNNTLGFWWYRIPSDSWYQLAYVPLGPRRKKVKGGTDLAVVHKTTPATSTC